MPYVNSATILFIEHDPARLNLHVTFRGAGTYIFHDVSESVYEAFLKAPSKGRFYNDHIRQNYASSLPGGYGAPIRTAAE
jgi:hypothetical protein